MQNDIQRIARWELSCPFLKELIFIPAFLFRLCLTLKLLFSPGVFVCRKDFSATSQCRCRVQSTDHAYTRSASPSVSVHLSFLFLSYLFFLLLITYSSSHSCVENNLNNLCDCVWVVFSPGTPSVPSVSSKVGAPVSLTGQRFTVQIPPPSQTTTTKTSKTTPPPSPALTELRLLLDLT